MSHNAFPNRLQKLRERRQISQKTLGELCGLSKNMIARYERGQREPSVETLVAIADFFDVSVDDLLGRKNFF